MTRRAALRSPLRPRRSRRLAAAVAVVCSVCALAGPALAAFDAFAEGQSHTISSGTLAAPTGLSASCTLVPTPRVNLSWTQTSSTFSDGYQILRSTTSGSGYASVGTTSGRGTTTFVDATVSLSTTYYYVVKATRNSWTSPSSGEASITTLGCL
jgi:predicted PurR-regulated permease PerM